MINGSGFILHVWTKILPYKMLLLVPGVFVARILGWKMKNKKGFLNFSLFGCTKKKNVVSSQFSHFLFSLNKSINNLSSNFNLH